MKPDSLEAQLKAAAIVVVALFILAMLAGCAAFPSENASQIDYSQRPADWPELVGRSHIVEPAELHQHCWNTGAAGVLACAIPDFCTKTCAMYYTDASFLPHIIEHEWAHCRGYDHPGGSNMRELWSRHKSYGRCEGSHGTTAKRF